MRPLRHDPDLLHREHLEEARRALALPRDVSGFAWHPFGCFAIRLPRRIEGECVWSRRLHVWHPETVPVGERSIYGVHTHSGTAKSHVLVGTLDHHLYAFRREGDGGWREWSKTGEHRTVLTAHVQGPTRQGVTHTLPPGQAHGVSRPPGFALSLFEQAEEGRAEPFTTWRRLDGPLEELVLSAPVEPAVALRETRAVVEEALFAAP